MPEAADASDEQLMGAYVDGDAGAFRALFARHAPALLRTMRRSLPSDADAHDVVQAAFLNLHRARADFRPGAKLRPWLYTIAYNTMRDHHRRRQRRREDAVEPGRQDQHPGGSDAPDARLRRSALHDALATLPEPQREVIVLHWFEGFSFPEIADIVGAGLSAVKVRAHRGYRRLRETLAEGGVTEDDREA